MALQKCRECGSKVSSKAKACQSCGSPVMKAPKGCFPCSVKTLLLAVVGICVVSAFLPKPRKDEVRKPVPASTPAPITESTVPKANVSEPEPTNESVQFRRDSPSIVGRYLEKEGLKTDEYMDVGAGEYSSISPYKVFGDGLPQCNMSYFVEGSKRSVKRLTLTAHVNNQLGKKQAHSELLAASLVLSKKATAQGCPQEARKAIEAAKSGEWKRGDVTFKVIRDEFTGTLNGYTLRFQIE